MPNNDHLVLITGESDGGKSASLRNLPRPEGVLYCNCESNKKLPFKADFQQVSITDPKHVPSYIEKMEDEPKCHTIVIDTLTFLLDMYESMYVINATNTMQAWGDFAQYFKNMMQNQVAKSTKNILFLAHVESIINETDMVLEKKVPVKGALKKNGIEAYFSTVVSARKVNIAKLDDYKNDFLTITPEEEMIGVKYVYQTRITKETVHERIRSPIDMWSVQETFIDNNALFLLKRLHQFYK